MSRGPVRPAVCRDGHGRQLVWGPEGRCSLAPCSAWGVTACARAHVPAVAGQPRLRLQPDPKLSEESTFS